MVAGAIAVAVAVTPAGAHAASVRVDGNLVIYEAGPGERNRPRVAGLQAASVGVPYCRFNPYLLLECSEEPFGTHAVVRVADPGVGLTAGPGCVPTGLDAAQCSTPGRAWIRLSLGDGADGFANESAFTVGMDGGPGDDVLSGGDNDMLAGGTGADTLDGENISYAGRTRGVSVSVDGVANDGEAGEGDRVAGRWIHAGSGADVLSGFEFAYAAAGNDRIQGVGSGVVDGGPGDDELLGAPGFETFYGGDGRDEIRAADGDGFDQLYCGAGNDRAFIDAGDHAYAECERVTR